MEWSKEQINFLMAAYENNTCLWDVSSKDYKNRNKRRDAWAQIATDMESTPQEVQKKMKIIITQYRREKRRIADAKKSGSSEVKQSKWFAFTRLHFLDGISVSRKTTDSCNSKALDADSESTSSLMESNNCERWEPETPDGDVQFMDELSILSSGDNLKKMEWTKEQIDFLIAAYENNICLWNVSSKDYKNRNKRREAWAQIASDMESTSQEIQKKMKIIITQYRREKKRIADAKKSGSSKVKQSKWFAFTRLHFLDGISGSRKTTDSCNSKALDVDSESTSSLMENHNCERWEPETLDGDVQFMDELSSEENPVSTYLTPSAKRVKVTEVLEAVHEAVSVMNSALELQKFQPTQKTPNEAFGEMVGLYLDNLPTKFEQGVVRNKINQIIFDADTGLFEEEKYRQSLKNS